MPEALAILFILIVAGGVYLYAWVQARNPARRNAAEDQARLERHEAWLRQRLELAKRERWGADMVRSIEAELLTTRERLAAMPPEPKRG